MYTTENGKKKCIWASTNKEVSPVKAVFLKKMAKITKHVLKHDVCCALITSGKKVVISLDPPPQFFWTCFWTRTDGQIDL